MSVITFINQAITPNVPAAGRVTIFSKAVDKHVHTVDENGVDLDLTAGLSNAAIRKSTTGTLNVGDAVYLVGWDPTANVIAVEKAQADSTATMPAIGVVAEAATDATTGTVRLNGQIDNVDTSSWVAGSNLYISTTVAGSFTVARPTGATDVIQQVIKVALQNVVTGVIIVQHAGRNNGLPQLADGKVWEGDSNNTPAEVDGATTQIAAHNADVTAHTALSRVDGSRAFTGEVAGVTPTVAASLARKDYVDTTAASEAASAVSTHNADVSAHTALSRVDGTRAFTGEVAGITPTAAASLTRKDYVDGEISTAVSTHNSDVSAHTALSRVDGTRAFTGEVAGITPTAAASLARKDYVDTTAASEAASAVSTHNVDVTAHTALSRVDGTRAFTGEVAGITPTAAASLTRKDYVDGEISTAVSTHNSDAASHTALSRVDGSRAFTGEVAGVTPTVDASLSTKEYVDGKDPAIFRNAKTGLFKDFTGILAVNGGDPTKIDIAASNGRIINFVTDPDNPTETSLVWTAFIAVTIDNLATEDFTSIYIEDTGGGVPGVFQNNVNPTPELRRSKIYIGVVLHLNNIVVESVGASPVLGFDHGAAVDDLMIALGDFNTSGNVYAANGANLLLDKSAGTSFGRSISTDLDKPNDKINILQTGITTYVYSLQDGGVSFELTLEAQLDPDQYDDGSGTLQPVSSNDFTVQRILFDPRTSLTALEYGQVIYNTLNDAIDGITQDGVAINPILRGGILRGWAVMREGITDLAAAVAGGTAAILENLDVLAQPSGAATDVNAVHVNQGGEISTIIAKTVPISTDILIMEDAAASFVKKKLELGAIVTSLTGPDADTRIATHNSDAASHTALSRVDGTRAFTGEVAGVTPTVAASLTRKDYVDTTAASEAASAVSTHNADVSAHTALSRVDGTRAFTGEVAGITPTVAASLTRKDYVDGQVTSDISTHNSDAAAHTALVRVDGSRVMTGVLQAPSIIAESTLPQLRHTETDAPVDEKKWAIRATGGDWRLYAVADDELSSNILISVSRTGIVGDAFSLIVPLFMNGLDITGADDVQSRRFLASTFDPKYALEDINGVADASKSYIKHNATQMEIGLTTDDELTDTDAILIRRVSTSAVVTVLVQIELGSSGPTINTGSGTPEGATTAPVSSVFHRDDGGAGTSFYVKEEGTGNTGWKGLGAPTVYYFPANELLGTATADWAVNGTGASGADTNNSGLTVILLDDTTEEGVGLELVVPVNATKMQIYTLARAETAPGGAVVAKMLFYEREISNGAAPTAWSSSTALTDVDLGANEFFVEDETDDTLANWGLTAGKTFQFQLTRTSTGDTLTGDLALKSIRVEFT